MISRRSPYVAAGVVGAVVLMGYLLTLAPSVTFWDAGEFIAAARILGIPHPPGTPFWVMFAHVWGLLLPGGDYAWRLNLLSAVCGAVAAGCWFLVAHASARRGGDDTPEWLALGTGAAAALISAFAFTTWQNAVEAEVYAVAMLAIALACWLAVRWRTARGTPLGDRLLLAILYLGALSIGNHLLALLAGPAIIAMLAVESRSRPLDGVGAQARERVQLAVLAVTWLLLIALGLGHGPLTLLLGAATLAAMGWAVRHRQPSFALLALLIVVVGLSPYLFLYLRAQQGPWINEADPSTWEALVAVIRRAQYPIRTPLDDPTILHGPGNPGRTVALLMVQLANYGQYFDWQWARSLGDRELTSVPRLLVTALAVGTGAVGAAVQRRRDPSGFALVLVLFVVTGLGLVGYMNFKPGPTVGWSHWTSINDHEVRERDYFFIASFTAWALWVAAGLGEFARRWHVNPRVTRWAPAVFLLALIPAAGNARDASRRHGADVTLARDFSRALLESVPPGGILFTWGDNDTFPLWHAQAVDGIRPDVTIICLALAETDWYARQVRDHRAPVPDPARMAAVWRDAAVPRDVGPAHTLDDATIDGIGAQRLPQDLEVPLATGGALRLPAGMLVTRKDVVLVRVVQENAGRRPIAWSVTTAHKLFGAPVIQQGLALVLPIGPVDTLSLVGGGASGADGAPFDYTTTTRLMAETWQFEPLLTRGAHGLDGNIGAMARTVAVPYAQVGIARLERGDTVGAIIPLQQAARLLGEHAEGIEAVLREIGSISPR